MQVADGRLHLMACAPNAAIIIEVHKEVRPGFSECKVQLRLRHAASIIAQLHHLRCLPARGLEMRGGIEHVLQNRFKPLLRDRHVECPDCNGTPGIPDPLA